MENPSQEGLVIRCRCPSTSFTLNGISPELKANEFQLLIQQKTGIQPSMQIFKSGFPPMELPWPDDSESVRVGSLIPRGTLLIVDEYEDAQKRSQTTDFNREKNLPCQSGRFPTLPDFTDESVAAGSSEVNSRMASVSEQEDLDRAIALSLHQADQQTPRTTSVEEFEPPPIISEPLKNGSCVIRRFVDSDNSCLFTAVAYLMEHNRLRGYDLRFVIASAVRDNKHDFNEAILGRPRWEYSEWISNPKNWGGEIEARVLSQYYGVQIATYDIQSTNCYVYGSDLGFKERVMLVYDGIHYDALAISPFPNAPEEMDVTVFDPYTPEGQAIIEAATRLVSKFKETYQFTNTSTFQLRCDDCGRGFSGQDEAVNHQRVTGHYMFSEYR